MPIIIPRLNRRWERFWSLQAQVPAMFMPRRSVGVLITWLFFLFLPLIQGDAVNRTIDDASSDVIYSPITPQGPWANQNCEVCAIKPDLSQVFDNTYTAATWYPTNGTMSITMQFTGTAIYVFFVLVNNVGAGLSTETLVDFTLDGNSPQRFEHTADSKNPPIQYNQLVFNQLNLKNTQHTLVISAPQVPTSIYVNFDYAKYTFEDDVVSSSGSPSPQDTNPITNAPSTAPVSPSPGTVTGGKTTSSSTATTSSASDSSTLVSTSPTSPASTTPASATPVSTSSGASQPVTQTQSDSATGSNKSKPTGAIVGAVVGVVILLLLAALCVVWYRRRYKTKSLEVIDHFPVMADLLDESETTATRSPVVSDKESHPSPLGKFEEINRARQLAENRRPGFPSEEVASVTSGTSQDPPGQSLSLLGRRSQRGQSGSASGRSTSGTETTREMAQQIQELRDQVSLLRGQQSASREVLLENPPPGYEPDPPTH